MKPHFGCPVQATANAIAGKWKVQIIWHLVSCPRRFGELRKLLSSVSEKVLTAQLRELEADLIVRRDVLETQPPQVTYSLTPAGEELVTGLQILCEWGTKHLGVAPRMGTSVAGPIAMQKLGFTTEHVAEVAKSLVKK